MITDPQVVAATRVMRRRAEQIRDLLASLEDDAKKWIEIGALIPNDDKEVVIENRESEGVTTLTGADLHAMNAIGEKISNTITEIGDQPIVHKFCVRRLLE